MQVTETVSEGLKREYKIVISAKDIDDKVNARLGDIARQANLPGFRPGKAPLAVVKGRFGQAALGEVLNEALQSSSQQAMQERALKPALQPKLEVGAYAPGKDLEYTLAVEILPDIVPGDFSAIVLERLVCEADDKEVDGSIERIAADQTSYEKADRKAEKSDAVLIDFVGKVDGVAFEGGAAKDHQLVLGSSSFVEGFEDQLLGAAAGDKRVVKITFPKAYANDKLAGKGAEFDVEVKEVRAAKKPKIDDDFAKGLGLENLEALKKAVREQIGKEYVSVARTRLKRSLLDKLSDSHDFAVPPGMVDLEFGHVWGQVEADMKRTGVETPEPGKSLDEAKAEYRKISERRVRLGLLLSEVGRKNNIQVGQEEINRAIAEQARRFPGQEKQVFEYFSKSPEAQASLRAPLFEEKVVDFVLEIAKVTDKKVSKDELFEQAEDKSKESR